MGEKGDTSQATGGLGERLVRDGGEGEGAASSGSSGWGLSDMTDAVQGRVTDTAGGAVSGLRGKDDDKDKD